MNETCFWNIDFGGVQQSKNLTGLEKNNAERRAFLSFTLDRRRCSRHLAPHTYINTESLGPFYSSEKTDLQAHKTAGADRDHVHVASADRDAVARFQLPGLGNTNEHQFKMLHDARIIIVLSFFALVMHA